MTSLVPFTSPTSPADAVREVARTDAALAVLSEHKASVKAWLDQHMHGLRETAGSDVTVKHAGASAFWSGGNLQLTVTDAEAFARWVEKEGPNDVEWTERVEADPDGLAWLLDIANNPTDSDTLAGLADAIRKVVTRTDVPVFAEGLLDDLALDATETHLHAKLIETAPGNHGNSVDAQVTHTPPRLFDVRTGEVVPGLTVTRTPESLVVRGGKLKKQFVEQMKTQLFALDQGETDA